MTQAIETTYRLSPQQRRLWLLGQGDEFRAQALLRLEGPLDRARLRHAATLLVRRHEIFRTAFVRLPGFKALVQAVRDAADPAWDVTDLRAHSPAEHSLLIEQHAAAERLRALDLERAPLVSFSLFILDESTHVLAVTLPALCADEQTLDNLAADLGRGYEALSTGAGMGDGASAQTYDDASAGMGDDEVVQYARFSEWQHELLASEEGEAAREFWRAHAEAAFNPPSLPLESRPVEPVAYAPAALTLEVPAPLAAQVASAAPAHGTDEEVFLLACWQTLLWRLTGRAEVATHVLCSGRVYEEMAGAMGLYARWPFVVTNFEEDYQFAEVVGQVGEAVASANEWQEYYSWERLEKAAADPADGNEPAERATSPGFGFTWERAAGGQRFGGVSFTLKQRRALTERFRLRLACRAEGGALALTFQYDPACYTARAVELLADYFLTLLRAVATGAHARVGQLDLLSEEARRRLLVEWNDTRRTFPAARCVHELFEAQAARTPDAPAVSARDERLTFAQLEARANQLAHYLRGRGVGADVPVVLLAERSVEMVVGLLGILKAGGAYVPFDPAYPVERLSFMLEDTGAPLVLTQARLRDALLPGDARAICLDTQWPEIAAESALTPPPRLALDPENLAYVIYTSGSTGKPKGVGVRHRSVVNLATALRAAVYDGLEGALRVGVNASISFDSSVKQLVQLLDGHSLHVVPEEVRPDGEALLAYVREQSLDVLDCTPSQLRLLLDAGLLNARSGAPRLVLVGGEAIDADMWSLLAGQEEIEFFNVYGPTECTVDATLSRVSRAAAQPIIGRPIANATAYVLDGRMRPVPVGVAGELYLGGGGVARGYLNRAALTAERFVPDPFGGEPGARLYRTGDLARFNAGGEIEYLGRADNQVKVRGHRVELGEIEAVLRAHEAVREAVVLLRDNEGGGARLVGYVVSRGDEPSVADLKTYLREQLPEHMMPAELVVLAELPLTPNGKIDRRALLSYDVSAGSQRRAYVAARTPVEEVLAGVWAEVLGVERVGVGENFFDLGGHSLLATQVVSRVRKALRVELPLRSLFELPTVEGLALCVERELKAGGAEPPPEIERVSRDEPLPLSFAQQRLWFLDQLEPDSTLYNVPTVLRLAGTLDVAAFEKSLGEVIRRHEILRTIFAMRDGHPVQVVMPAGTWSLPVVDLRGVASRQAEVERATLEEMRRPFDLSRGPLLRALLLRVEDEEHVLVFTVHHIVSDEWSKGVLVRETAALYEAFRAGAPSPLPEPPIQYADFAQWHRRWMSGAALESQLAYWREQLRGELPVLNLPTDHAPPASPSHRGAHVPVRLSASLAKALKELSRREGATLFMTLLAGFKCLLHRYADQEDILVGTAIANRTRAEIEELIGFFVNTLVLRTDLSGSPTFRELIGRVRETTLGAYAHQDLPFEKLVEELQLSRDAGRAPLLQVVFTLQNAPVPPLALAGLTLTPQPVETGTAKFDIVLNMAEVEQGLAGWFEYRSDLFDTATIERMVSHFETLLGAAVADPDSRVSELPLLRDGERRELLASAGEGRRYPQALGLHELFERRARTTPTAVAVTFEGESLTYAELNARANRLARHLRGLGVGSESRVALLLERSPELIVAILATLKAGAAYLPIDPSYPRERLAFMLADSGSRVVLTEPDLAAQLPAEGDVRVINIAAERGRIEAEAADDLRVNLDPENAAYVIYTSGSTGQPKGVVITHGNVGRLFASCEPLFDFSASDVWTLFHSSAFDFSVWEMWGALAYGGRLVVVPYWVSRSPEAFLALLSEQKVTILSQTPSSFRQLAAAEGEAGEASPPLSLRAVVFGGEALEPASLRGWVRRHGYSSPALVNMYGITETCVHVTHRRVQAGEAEGGGASLVGVALGDLRLYVLDARMEPTPEGVAGELYVGGDGLARGYLHRPGLTAERFVPDPFGAEPGARLYKTGDVGRWVSNAGGREVEYLGRCDQQVKVRGFRIELGEIESALLAHAGIGEVAVVAREIADGGGTHLVAYYVAAAGAAAGAVEASVAELRSHLAERLPEHMTPSYFMRMEALPLTSNGKLDRRALPAPEASSGREYVAPQGATEELLCDIWGEVLGVERIGVEDNFFELGGHSLLATQVVSRVREVFVSELPLKELFEHPTVEALARRVEAARGERDEPGAAAPELRRLAPGETRALSFAQRRLWFLDQLEPGSSAYNVSAALRLTGNLDAAALESALNEIMRRHDSLRTNFAKVEGEAAQVVAPFEWRALPITDLSGLTEDEREAEVRRLADEKRQQPFNLAQGTLLRTSLLRLADEEHVLLVTMHHIISDGWSTGVLVRELTALYAAYTRGEESPLKELSIQYADYAAWQREYLSGKRLARQLGYWKERLTGAPALLALPTDRPRPAVQSYRGAPASLALSEELTERLRELSRAHGCTLYMTLLAGWQALLSRYSGQEDIVVGTPIAGRTRRETEDLIGFFTNTLALRTDVSGDPSFEELLGRVRETTLGAYAHQDVPFEKLVEELAPERSLSHQPLFQVVLSLQNTPRSSLRLPGLELAALPGRGVTAKFDLALSFAESEGGLSGALEYSTDLFDEATAARLLRHYARVLEAMTADPSLQVSEVRLLGAEEEQLLTHEWNATQRDYERDAGLARLFRRQAQATPEAVAIVCGDERVTYAELDARATGVAARLRAVGVRTETQVAVMLERSTELVVAFLGVLKAGGTYVPLDPEYPQARLAFIMEDTQSPVLLTHSALLDSLPESWAQVVCIDIDDEAAQETGAGEWEAAEATGDNLAYVMYTSGSTGEPKGVAVTQRAVARLVCNTDYVALGTEEVVLHMAPTSFDASTFELWGALLNGARLVVAPPGQLSLVEVGELIESYGVTTMWLTAGLFHLMVDERHEDLRGLRQLLAGGDVLSTAHVNKLLAEPHARTLINGYGPTENTTFTCCHRMSAGERYETTVPIGRPIANTRVYLLDSRMRPVPVGVYGELCTGGDGLARGYHNRPALTAERFVPDPFDAEPGARLYRTGDLARWRADGTIEFFGRRDQQLKVRGFRVEPGEIEAVMLGVAGVREAMVEARGEGALSRWLVAYVVWDDATAGAERQEAQLRRRLDELLPEYMMPSAFVTLERMPLTPNGKVDRRALPEPEASDRLAEYEGPRTATEERLCAIWGEVLELPQVGVRSNFFDLGGHSLLATQVVSRVGAEFGIELPLRRLFESPTVAELVEEIERARREGADAMLPPVARVSREGNLPLSFAQQRLWFIQQLEPGSSAYNLSSAVRLKGQLSVPALEQTLDEIVRRHEVLRTTFAEVDSQPVQVIHPAVSCALPQMNLSGLVAPEREAALRRIMAEEAKRPFDLSRGPLLRASLVRLDEEEHALLVMMHHIVSDGWSTGVLIRELTALYTAFARGEESPLPELPVQYADYVVWQRERLSGETLEQQLAYWKEQLTGAPALLTLPTDRPRPAVQSYRGAMLPFTLSAELTERLRELTRRHDATLFMTLLAGWQALLSRYTGQEDVVVGAPIANRTRTETEDLIGFFVNTLALRANLSGEPTFEELLRRVRETTLGAYAHQEVPFERLVEELAPERSMSHQPLFQVVFALQNAPRGSLRLPGLELASLGREITTAKFDLMVNMWETEGALAGALEYSTDLFDAATAERMTAHFSRLLAAVAADEEVSIGDIALLSDEEERVFFAEAAAQESAAETTTLTQLFERQVELTPDAPAVEGAGGQLTYAELNARVETLARRLRAFGVVPESRVGLFLERSAELVIAVLATLKAGGAYVPLDPEYPRARLAFIMEDAGATVLLTQTSLLDSLPETTARVLCVDERGEFDADDAGSEPATRVAEGAWAQASPANLCYVIYTSGSTGTPKGVGITHASASAYVQWAATAYSAGEPARMALYSSVAFDLTVTSLWLPLLTGGSVVACPGTAVEALEAAVASGAELLKLTPSHLRLLVGRDLQGTGVRRLILGGEGLPTELARQAVAAFGEGLDVCNEYGPTEATVGCMLYRFDPDNDRRAEVPIGRGRAGARVYVLDGRLRPAAEGVRGELYVGGECLARGYVGRAGLTAERFIPDPHATEAGARMYRTGDAARRLAGGEVEYLGRLDSQVKVRGVRLELGEVRAALNRHGQVRDSYAVVRAGAGGMAALVCYYAARQAVEAEELRRHMGGELPAEAQPAGYVWVRRLPLTLNGKVNEAALPEWRAGEGSGAREHVAARTETERALCEAWREVLGIERVGVEDNFFELGGHSLLATQVISRVREAFRVNVTLGDLFTSPTVKAFAAKIEEAILAQSAPDDLDAMLAALEEIDDETKDLLIGNGDLL